MNMREKRGITLVALIITVIVMLILASVTFKMAIDVNIISSTRETANKMQNQQNEHENMANDIRNVFK